MINDTIDRENSIEIQIICKHSYGNGEFGSSFEVTYYRDAPIKCYGGCYLCDLCRAAIPYARDLVAIAAFTQAALSKQVTESAKSHVALVPDYTSIPRSDWIGWGMSKLQGTKILGL